MEDIALLEDDAISYILEVPIEILYRIFSFIKADHLLNSVAKVCVQLRAILQDEKYWKERVLRQFPKSFPIVSEYTFSWSDACKQREICNRAWKNKDMKQDMITLLPKSGCGSDAVHLTERHNMCICGTRDGSITAWKIREENESNYATSGRHKKFESQNFNGHERWVWSLSSYEDELCSTSFDSSVRFWDLCGDSSEKTCTETKTAVLCSSYIERNVVVVGCMDKELLIVDSRDGKITNQIRIHRSKILCVASNDQAIVSTGENGDIFIVDKRNTDSILQQTKLKDSFCMSLHLLDQQLWTGSKRGEITVFDAHDLSNIQAVRAYNHYNDGKVTGIHYTHGAVYSCCTNGCLKIHEPNADPALLTSLSFFDFQAGGVADISVRADTLAASTSEGLVALWNP